MQENECSGGTGDLKRFVVKRPRRHNADMSARAGFWTPLRAIASLGKRRRDERLAAIGRLDDRQIVGPAVIDGELSCHCSNHGSGPAIHVHWRRHFRMQTHGAAAAQRKLIFVMPTVVRADRIGTAIGG